ncbi:MAG: hypothetical protein ACXWJB_02950, partial [Limisphaerales bacterium]
MWLTVVVVFGGRQTVSNVEVTVNRSTELTQLSYVPLQRAELDEIATNVGRVKPSPFETSFPHKPVSVALQGKSRNELFRIELNNGMKYRPAHPSLKRAIYALSHLVNIFNTRAHWLNCPEVEGTSIYADQTT